MKQLHDKTADELIEDAVRIEQAIVADLKEVGRMLELAKDQHHDLNRVLCRLRVVRSWERTKADNQTTAEGT